MDYDPSDEVKAIDDTKAGVKGLVDSGIVEIPRIFIRPPHELAEELNMCKSTLQVPVVDLSGVEVEDWRKKIVDEIREASEKWGFFQLINYGIASSSLEGMIYETRKFQEQDVEVNKEYYSSDPTVRRVRYDSNIHLYKTKGKTANLKDSLHISWRVFGHNEPEEIPPICRKTSVVYINHVIKLEHILLGLLSEALGLNANHLKATECDKGQTLVCHYYPACPQPELNLGTNKHTDLVFLTILLQDQSGGLQVMRDNQWADVEPIEHGLVVNIGDLLQIPVVDLSGIEVKDRRKKIVDEIREECEKWGFFQLINHGVPSSVLEGMIDGTRKFHEQDVEVKKEYYSSDPTARRVRYDSNLHLYKTKGKTANLKDSLHISWRVFGHNEPEEIPPICRQLCILCT